MAAEVSPPAAQAVDNIGGGGTAVTTPSRAPEDFRGADGTYDWSKDKGGRTFLGYAAKYGVEDLVAFANSAPAVTGAWQGKQSGKCLTASVSGAAIAACMGGAGQSWSYAAKCGEATADGSKVTLHSCTGGANQAWFRQ
ncbi:glycoside hydrolase [Streptomyces sp. NPDC002838]|uniref:glycoside hydrolase n=1 Tax=Streptomyces sp. NPDC002838 TaxID=3154436 RepID=UPI00332565A6